MMNGVLRSLQLVVREQLTVLCCKLWLSRSSLRKVAAACFL